MKQKIYGILGSLSALCLLLFTGCTSGSSLQLANELTFPLDDIMQVSLSYDEEPITFLKGDGTDLVVKEYMTKNSKRYHATVTKHGDSIHISEGGKPWPHAGFSRKIEVYLPRTYQQALSVTTTNGDINLSKFPLQVSELRVDSTAGTVQIADAIATTISLSTTSGILDLGSLQAEEIRLETTSASVTCDQLSGHVTYLTTSGDAEIKSAAGSGSFTVNQSGRLQVTYTEVMGNLSLFNKNDSISLTIPAALAFHFDATTKNGSVNTTFSDQLCNENKSMRGTIGQNPTATIAVETKNGEIQVTQKSIKKDAS